MAPLMTRMARMARMLTRMTRWLTGSHIIHTPAYSHYAVLLMKYNQCLLTTCHLYPDLGVVLLLSFKLDVNSAKNITVLSTSMAALVMLLKKANSLLFSPSLLSMKYLCIWANTRKARASTVLTISKWMSFNKPQGATISVNLTQQFHIFSHKWFLNMNRVETCTHNKYLPTVAGGLKFYRK